MKASEARQVTMSANIAKANKEINSIVEKIKGAASSGAYQIYLDDCSVETRNQLISEGYFIETIADQGGSLVVVSWEKR